MLLSSQRKRKGMLQNQTNGFAFAQNALKCQRGLAGQNKQNTNGAAVASEFHDLRAWMVSEPMSWAIYGGAPNELEMHCNSWMPIILHKSNGVPPTDAGDFQVSEFYFRKVGTLKIENMNCDNLKIKNTKFKK